MIEQNVQVLRCSTEKLWVRMGSQSGCTACDSGKGCGAGLFAKLLQREPVTLELARKDLEVRVGQMLTLAVPEQLYLKLVFVSFGWPLLAALAGAIVGYMVGSRFQLMPVLIDFMTLTAGILAAWFIMRFNRKRTNTASILGSMDITVYFPSATPNMCSGTAKDTEHV